MKRRIIQRTLLGLASGALPLRAFNRLLRAFRPTYRTETFFGARMDVELGDFVQSTIYHFGSWEPAISRLLPQLVRDSSVVVDIGANVGYYSLMASATASNVTVIAIEPSPRILPLLRRNLALNPSAEIQVVEAAVGPVEGTIPLFGGPRDNLGRTSIRIDSGFPQIAEVTVRPLQSIVTEEQRRLVSLIKIDVEGAELPIVEEIVQCLNSFSPEMSLLVEYSAKEKPRWTVVFDAMVKAGFRAYLVSNDYAWERHEAQWSSVPRPVNTLPDQQSDLLFSRVMIDEASSGKSPRRRTSHESSAAAASA